MLIVRVLCVIVQLIALGVIDFMGDTALSEQEKTRVTVAIYGQEYKMVGNEEAGYMRLVASIVDDKMKEISAQNLSLDTTKIAVLTAVNATHDLLKLQQKVEMLEEQLRSLDIK